MQAFMDVDHKGVEMNTSFTFNRRGQGLVKQIHKHGFPSSNVAIKIETFRSRFWRRYRYRRITVKDAGQLEGLHVCSI
jgi:hypothetical protein